MKEFLVKLNEKVNAAGGELSEQQSKYYQKRYMALLNDAEKECPLPEAECKSGKRGRMKK